MKSPAVVIYEAKDLYKEIRIENALCDESGNTVRLCDSSSVLKDCLEYSFSSVIRRPLWTQQPISSGMRTCGNPPRGVEVQITLEDHELCSYP